MAPALATYTPRDPSRTVLYTVIADHLETFLAALDDDPDATGLPAYVQREFYAYLQCGIHDPPHAHRHGCRLAAAAPATGDCLSA